MHECKNEGDETERRDGQGAVEHRARCRAFIFHSFYRTYHVLLPAKEERPAAVNFACCILCGAQIEDGFFSVQAFANGIVLSGWAGSRSATKFIRRPCRTEMAMIVSLERHHGRASTR
jgi:hypothetical protein